MKTYRIHQFNVNQTLHILCLITSYHIPISYFRFASIRKQVNSSSNHHRITADGGEIDESMEDEESGGTIGGSGSGTEREVEAKYGALYEQRMNPFAEVWFMIMLMWCRTSEFASNFNISYTNET